VKHETEFTARTDRRDHPSSTVKRASD
jgi:hypothetical protein